MTAPPEWAKFAPKTGSPRALMTPREKYYRTREVEAIKQAQDHGYFIKADKSFILEKYGNEANKRKMSRIKLVKFPHLHLKVLGDIPMCNRLRICILHNNYIVKFDALKACKELVKLDLHSNLISSIPGADFWANLPHLMILNLHDNPIGHISNLHDLAVCRNLTILTMYDTPVSLKKNYRHHVVNTIWSLRSFDHHVVSDEEIIEDAAFRNGPYATLSPNLYIDTCPLNIKQDTTYQEEIKAIKELLSAMSSIMAHFSPVLIVQRYLRGWMTRRRYALITETRIWAAVTIQRWIRKTKGWTLPSVAKWDAGSQGATPIHGSPSPPFSRRPNIDAFKVDYDNYMQNRRPGSTSSGEVLSKSSSGMRKRRNITINLSKLEQGPFSGFQEDTIQTPQDTSRDVVRKTTTKKSGALKSKEEKRRRANLLSLYRVDEEEKPVKIKIKDVRQFFGAVVNRVPTPDDTMSSVLAAEEEGDTPYRLRGIQKTIYTDYCPIADVMRANLETGKAVRDFESYHHTQKLREPKKQAVKHNLPTTDQRIFNRVQGTMGLSCLNAVGQAYKDRKRAEKMATKMENILNMRESREEAKERVRLYHEEKRQGALKQRERDSKTAIEALERRELQQISYMEKSQERRSKTREKRRGFTADKSFASDFNAQQTSISLALQRHDRMSKREDTITSKIETVDDIRNADKQQQDLVKTYLEHRQLMRQSENDMARAALDTKLLQEANERIMQARQRVAKLKAKQKQVQAFYPLPVSPEGKPGEYEGRIGRFEDIATMFDARTGKQPTYV